MQELGYLEEAKIYRKKTINLEPSYAHTHFNLAITLPGLGKTDEATAAYSRAIRLRRDYPEALINFSEIVSGRRFPQSNSIRCQAMEALLDSHTYYRPEDIVPAVISIIKKKGIITIILQTESSLELRDNLVSFLEGVCKVRLLLQIMRISPIPDVEIEKALVQIRNVITKSLSEVNISERDLSVLSALMCQCYLNEYILLFGRRNQKRFTIRKNDSR